MTILQQKFLSRAVALARRTDEKVVFPNPRVGCLVVKNGKIIAEGWHKKFGGPHAEADALAKFPEGGARGATVYVNLEPCADWKGKKTPSCAKRLVHEGVRRVVIGMLDPQPKVRGKGVSILRRAGVAVVVASPRVAFYDVNDRYLCAVAENDAIGARPFVLLKTAMSVDGKIGTPDHHAVALSNDADRRAVDHLRAACDAIMVGGTTFRNDKPRLTVKDPALVRRRLHDGRDAQPLKVAVVGNELLVGRGPAHRYVLGKKRVDLARALSILAIRYGVRTLLLEGGGELNAAMLAAGYVDRIRVATAPIILGGRTAPTLVDGEGFSPPLSLEFFGREKKGEMEVTWYGVRG